MLSSQLSTLKDSQLAAQRIGNVLHNAGAFDKGGKGKRNMQPWLDRPFNPYLKNHQLMHLKREVLAVLPQWCLGKLKEVVHPRQTLACAICEANVATLRDTIILPMAVDSKAKV